MTTFRSRNRSTAVVPADRDAIWAVLSDPDALAELTPLVAGIEPDGDVWRWRLTGVRALGVCVEPTFTEVMTFDEGRHIGFRHAPDATDEKAGAEGTYDLADDPEGTHLAIDIEVSVDLPLPGVARGAVERVMAGTMARTGARFARNLYARLGLDPASARVPEPAT